ncbi:MAG: cyclic nucleotide-binding domain-containing protein [Nitrospirae bacterium]|nr:cyclic nucleotide-binding domain-containing protein [Nitrospirota bacterium]
MISYDDMKGIDFFKDFTEDELRAVQVICNEESYRAGDIIFNEDTPAMHLYVLKSGKVSIDIKVGSGKYISVLTLSNFAEPLGWSALVEPFRFTATTRCVEDSTIISIDAIKLLDLIMNDYRMGFLVMRRIARLISERVRDTRLQLIHTFYG